MSPPATAGKSSGAGVLAMANPPVSMTLPSDATRIAEMLPFCWAGYSSARWSNHATQNCAPSHAACGRNTRFAAGIDTKLSGVLANVPSDRTSRPRWRCYCAGWSREKCSSRPPARCSHPVCTPSACGSAGGCGGVNLETRHHIPVGSMSAPIAWELDCRESG